MNHNDQIENILIQYFRQKKSNASRLKQFYLFIKNKIEQRFNTQLDYVFSYECIMTSDKRINLDNLHTYVQKLSRS